MIQGGVPNFPSLFEYKETRVPWLFIRDINRVWGGGGRN
jgi:hypothetical protein